MVAILELDIHDIHADLYPNTNFTTRRMMGNIFDPDTINGGVGQPTSTRYPTLAWPAKWFVPDNAVPGLKLNGEKVYYIPEATEG